mmetsp:Transcript_46443/g.85068  ORF Transcript_46443/g.85068 Transcript_46443/m.85068 type:complete len:641 (-) Transcript_46443:85-2007(-)
MTVVGKRIADCRPVVVAAPVENANILASTLPVQTKPRPASAPRARACGTPPRQAAMSRRVNGTPPRQAVISRRTPAASRGRAPKARPQGRAVPQKKTERAATPAKVPGALKDLKDMTQSPRPTSRVNDLAPSPGKVPVPALIQSGDVATHIKKPRLRRRDGNKLQEVVGKIRQSEDWALSHRSEGLEEQVEVPPVLSGDLLSGDQELSVLDYQPSSSETEASSSEEASHPQEAGEVISNILTATEGMLNYTVCLPGGWPAEDGAEESDSMEEDDTDWRPSYLSSEHRQRVQAVLDEQRQLRQDAAEQGSAPVEVPTQPVPDGLSADRPVTRPPSRGGESWEPLGQTTPPAYETSIPEDYRQFQQLLQPDVGTHVHQQPASDGALEEGPAVSDPVVLEDVEDVDDVEEDVEEIEEDLPEETEDEEAEEEAEPVPVAATSVPRPAALPPVSPTVTPAVAVPTRAPVPPTPAPAPPPPAAPCPQQRFPVEKCLHLLANALLEVAADIEQPKEAEQRRLGWQLPSFGEHPLARFRDLDAERKREGEPKIGGKTWNQIRALCEEVFGIGRSAPSGHSSSVSPDPVVDITVDDRLDLLVLEEIRADEATWLDVSNDVDHVKTQVAHMIFSDLVDDTLEEMQSLWPP